MRRSDKIHFLLVLAVISTAVCAESARGGTIWQFTHEASGAGSARVFDGGPAESGSDATTSPDDPRMEFSPLDLTRPGVLGSDAFAIGSSDMGPGPGRFTLNADLATTYSASSHLGADRPGGEAEAFMSSVVELVMPVDAVVWSLVFDITRGSGFTGEGSLLVENVTRSEILADFSGTNTMTEFIDTTLNNVAGDVIRVSVAGSASGSVPAGVASHGGFDFRVRQTFFIPEPTSALMLGLGALFVFKRRRQIKCEPLEAFAL